MESACIRELVTLPCWILNPVQTSAPVNIRVHNKLKQLCNIVYSAAIYLEHTVLIIVSAKKIRIKLLSITPESSFWWVSFFNYNINPSKHYW